MKKLLGMFLASALVLGACGSDEKEKNEEPKKETKVSENDNKVYGKLTNGKEKSSSPVTIDDVTYILGNNNKILQAEKDFSNVPLDKEMDKNHLNEHIKELMSDDAKFVSDESDNEQKYHSEKLNKDYFVTYSLNDDGKVTSIIVSSFQ
ncbi:MAG: hypothetical protein Q4F01_02050 [Staphylococcus rostri]|uniref:hypothetical protein n=1 Tax=Staphylococcus rostri TaxID=522262 RepID=UPI0026E085B2|nr:hypothetical protein [Staphylococcus rostri]MDO5374965.1 hypothetical protein [Staphylococcus rostri]